MAVERGHQALSWLGHNVKMKANAELVASVMRAAAKSDEPTDPNDAVMLSHSIAVLLEYLDTDPEVSEQTVVQLEWIYFQSLRHLHRPARGLHRALAQDPEFFVYLIKLIFLPPVDNGVVEPEIIDMRTARKLGTKRMTSFVIGLTWRARTMGLALMPRY